MTTHDTVTQRSYWRPKRVAQMIALAFAVVPSAYCLSRPTFGWAQSIVSSDGTSTYTEGYTWDVAFELVVLVPVALTLLPLIPRRTAAWVTASVVCTVLLGVFALGAMLSLGPYFVPAALAALIALFLEPRTRT